MGNDFNDSDRYLIALANSISDDDERIRDVIAECENCSKDEDSLHENACMNVIEKIVSISKEQNRAGAIKEAAKELIVLRQTNSPENLIRIHKRVLHEFIISSDDEYNTLRALIFEN